MTKTIFEEMGGTYRQVGEYLLPTLQYEPKKQSVLAYGDSGTQGT